MEAHKIKLNWKRNTPDFIYETYDRTHDIKFSGGIHIQSSAAPVFLGNANLPNPEELLIAAVSSCYMLTFLAVAAKQNFIIDDYEDNAAGILGKNANGKTSIVEITLRPKINFGAEKQPDSATLAKIHEKTHANCFITNSITAQVKVV